MLENIRERLSRYHIINWHEHVAVNGGMRKDEHDRRLERLVQDMALTGMDKCVISRPLVGDGHHSFEEICWANDTVGDCVRAYPGKIYGLVFADALYGDKMVAEIDRCRREYGMVGVKMYYQYTMDDDMQNPIIEYCAEHDMPILMHAGHLTQEPDKSQQARLSGSDHMARAAKKYPNCVFQMAHIAGGGDWLWQLRGLEDCPNVYVDLSGSVLDAGTVEGLVKHIGANRLLFGTDGSFSASLGRVLAARITEEERAVIFNNPNFARYLKGGRGE